MKKSIFALFFVVLTIFTNFTYIFAENDENFDAAIATIENLEDLEEILSPKDFEYFKNIAGIQAVSEEETDEFKTFFNTYKNYTFNTLLPHSAYDVRWAKEYINYYYEGKTYKTGVDKNEDGYVSGRDLTLLKRSAISRLPFFGIDVSKYQGNIDWLEVSKYVNFAIIRAGFGKDRHDNNGDGVPDQVDTKWEQNIAGTERYGIPKGVYWYSYATTPAEAEEEAYFCLDTIKGHKLEYPVFFDMEEVDKLSAEQCTDITNAFVNIIEDEGYACGIYMSKRYIYDNILYPEDYDYTWVAHWTGTAAIETDYRYRWQLWQFSGGETMKTTIPGIDGYVDWNLCNQDIPAKIRQRHLNGY